MNIINNNFGITKLPNNKKNYLNQDITFNSNVNIEDATYSNNKDFLLIPKIKNWINIPEYKQEGNKSNNSIDETRLNNSINNTNINNIIINNTHINNPNNANINNNNENDYSYVPIKICLIGYSFSRKKI